MTWDIMKHRCLFCSNVQKWRTNQWDHLGVIWALFKCLQFNFYFVKNATRQTFILCAQACIKELKYFYSYPDHIGCQPHKGATFAQGLVVFPTDISCSVHFTIRLIRCPTWVIHAKYALIMSVYRIGCSTVLMRSITGLTSNQLAWLGL